MVAEKVVSSKQKALDVALSEIEKSFGKGAIMRLGDKQRVDVDVIPTGCLPLDAALGIGGLPRGRIVEIYGVESAAKTTLALHCAAEAQRAGGTAAIIDVEHALDPVYAAAIGVDVSSLLVAQPGTGEEALEICDALVRSGAISLVIVDSVAALVPKSEIEGDMGDSSMGLQARLMGQALRKMGAAVGKTNTCIIFINQLREKIGVFYGPNEVTPGGKALKYWSSVRIELRKGESIKKGTDVVGTKIKAKIVKNKVAPPFRICEMTVMFGRGIAKAEGLFDAASDLGVITRAGASYSCGEEKIGVGREAVIANFADNPALYLSVSNAVRSKLGMPELGA